MDVAEGAAVGTQGHTAVTLAAHNLHVCAGQVQGWARRGGRREVLWGFRGAGRRMQRRRCRRRVQVTFCVQCSAVRCVLTGPRTLDDSPEP